MDLLARAGIQDISGPRQHSRGRDDSVRGFGGSGLKRAVSPRAAAARRYADFFRAVGLVTPHCPGEPPWQCFPVLFPEGSDLVAALESAGRLGVELRRYYRPALNWLAPPQYAALDPAPV